MDLESMITESLLIGSNNWKLSYIKKSGKELTLKKIKDLKLKQLLDFLTWKIKVLLISLALKEYWKK
jgi:hypothetical protein